MTEYLNSLTESEIKKLYKFICSPYFNKYRILDKLFLYLISEHPLINSSHLDRKNIHRILYERTKFNDANIRKLLSLLMQLIERYLLQKELEKNEFENRVLRLRSLRAAKLNKRYNKMVSDITKDRNDSFYKDQDYYFDRIMFYDELVLRASEKSEKITKYKKLKSLYVNYFFIYSNLVCYFQILFEKIRSNENDVLFKQSMFREVMKYTEDNKEELRKHHPNIIIMYLQIKMFLTYDDKYYYELLDYYKKYRSKFDFDLSRTYFLGMQLYLRTKIRSRIGNYHKNNILAFELSDLILKKKDYFRTYFEDGRPLDGFLFFDIVKNAFYLDKIEWLISFYNDFSTYIFKDHASDCKNIFNAVVTFQNKDFDNTLTYLTQISNNLPLIYLEGKFLQCMTSFELKHYEPLKLFIKNMSAYISNNDKISSFTAAETAVFIRYFKKLLKIRNSGERILKRQLNDFRLELDREKKFVPFKKWFYEKADVE